MIRKLLTLVFCLQILMTFFLATKSVGRFGELTSQSFVAAELFQSFPNFDRVIPSGVDRIHNLPYVLALSLAGWTFSSTRLEPIRAGERRSFLQGRFEVGLMFSSILLNLAALLFLCWGLANPFFRTPETHLLGVILLWWILLDHPSVYNWIFFPNPTLLIASIAVYLIQDRFSLKPLKGTNWTTGFLAMTATSWLSLLIWPVLGLKSQFRIFAKNPPLIFASAIVFAAGLPQLLPFLRFWLSTGQPHSLRSVAEYLDKVFVIAGSISLILTLGTSLFHPKQGNMAAGQRARTLGITCIPTLLMGLLSHPSNESWMCVIVAAPLAMGLTHFLAPIITRIFNVTHPIPKWLHLPIAIVFTTSQGYFPARIAAAGEKIQYCLRETSEKVQYWEHLIAENPDNLKMQFLYASPKPTFQNWSRSLVVNYQSHVIVLNRNLLEAIRTEGLNSVFFRARWNKTTIENRQDPIVTLGRKAEEGDSIDSYTLVERNPCGFEVWSRIQMDSLNGAVIQ